MKETGIGGGPSDAGPSPLISLEALRRALSGGSHKINSTASSQQAGSGGKLNGSNVCQCLQTHLQYLCSGSATFSHFHAQPQQHMSGKNIAGIGNSEDSLSFNSEFGRMIYTISILLMFSFVILMLMIRSIRRSSSTIEVEALLDAMRFREELDLQQRQKRRLQKAKNKVTAWLSKTNGKMWSSSPQIVLPNTKVNKKPVAAVNNRTNSLQSGGSYIPEIVISNSEDGHGAGGGGLHGPCSKRNNSCTPSLSLIYDFGVDELAICSRKNSECSLEDANTVDLSQFSDLSFNSSSDLMLAVPEEDEEGQEGQSSLPVTKEQRSASVVGGHGNGNGHWSLRRPSTSIGPTPFRGSRNSLQLTITTPSHYANPLHSNKLNHSK